MTHCLEVSRNLRLCEGAKDYERRVEALTKALAAAVDYIMLDRDCLFDSVTDCAGGVPDSRDRKDLAAVDALLDECRTALAAAQTGQQPDRG